MIGVDLLEDLEGPLSAGDIDRSAGRVVEDVVRVARDEALRKSVSQLEDQNRALKARVQVLQNDVKAGEDASARRSSAAQQVKAQLDDERAGAGLLALHGPGLSLTLRDGPDPDAPYA